ncbi:MAG TPA: dienelactone hydrolase family protein [Candidatus Binatia bacterium]|nr:dienelactone hydrolase family protein [Candidatus Binatia bacterium]
MGDLIDVKRPDGGTCPAYFAEPRRPGAAAGFVMIQEWWGVNDQMKGLADRLAGEGYRVLVPDLYRVAATTDPDEAGRRMNALDFGAATGQDIRGCARHLKEASAKVAVGGFCMGGALTVLAGVHVPELDAAVCFYGIPPVEAADPARMRVPFQGHFANRDDWCTPAAVDRLEAGLARAGVPYEVHRYDAQHAFMNERRPEVYDRAAADLAWRRMLDFLARTMAR